MQPFTFEFESIKQKQRFTVAFGARQIAQETELTLLRTHACADILTERKTIVAIDAAHNLFIDAFVLSYSRVALRRPPSFIANLHFSRIQFNFHWNRLRSHVVTSLDFIFD